MIRLKLFGGPELTGPAPGGYDPVLRQPKRLALLAYLASRRGFASRDTLTGLFWAESRDAQARSALRTALHFLRGAVGAAAITRHGDHLVGLDVERVWCDLSEFDEACLAGEYERALALYRGDLLPGLYVSGAPEVERWLDGERARVRQSAKAAALALARVGEATGDPREALRWARRAETIDPQDESVIRLILGLLVRCGDRAGALARYATLERQLMEESGCWPDPETAELALRIREAAEQPTVRSSSAATARDLPGTDLPASSRPRSWGLDPTRLLDLAPEIIFTADLQGRLTYVNRAGGELMGAAPESLVGRSYLELVREDFRELFLHHYLQQIDARTPVSYIEFPCISSEGREVWVSQTARLLYEDDEPVAVLAVARDVTSRRRADMALLEFGSREGSAYNRRGFRDAADERLRLVSRWNGFASLLRVTVEGAAPSARLTQVIESIRSVLREADLMGTVDGAVAVLALHESDAAPCTLDVRIRSVLVESGGDSLATVERLAYLPARECTADQVIAMVLARDLISAA